MDHLDTLRIFFSVAEHGSFVAASRSLGISPSRASRAVSSLETFLDTILLLRSTRAVALTEEGEAYLAAAKAAVSQLDRAADTLSKLSAEPSGRLTVSAPLSFGRLHVLPTISRLLLEYPKLEIRFLLLDRVVNLVEEGVDIAVRIGELADSSLRAVRLAETQLVLAASPGYLEQMGTPCGIEDLKSHKLISIETLPNELIRWHFNDGEYIKFRASLQLNSADAAVQAACKDVGIVRCYSYQASQELSQKNLIRLLPHCEPSPVPISAIYQSGRRNTPNIKTFINALKDNLDLQTY